MITWLVWDHMTGKLMLEVRHVPHTANSTAVIVALASTGYWPVDIDHTEASTQLSNHVIVNMNGSAPSQVLKQLTEAVRHVEWRELWVK